MSVVVTPAGFKRLPSCLAHDLGLDNLIPAAVTECRICHWKADTAFCSLSRHNRLLHRNFPETFRSSKYKDRVPATGEGGKTVISIRGIGIRSPPVGLVGTTISGVAREPITEGRIASPSTNSRINIRVRLCDRGLLSREIGNNVGVIAAEVGEAREITTRRKMC